MTLIASAIFSRRSLRPGNSPPVIGVSFIASPVPTPRKIRPGREAAERRERLRDDRRVVAHRRRQHARAEDDLRRRRRRGAEPGQDGGSVAAVVAPRLQVVGDAGDLEAARLRVLDELEQLRRAELLVGRLVAEGEGHTPHLIRGPAGAWTSGPRRTLRVSRFTIPCRKHECAGRDRPARGRPRDPRRREAILRAAIELVAEVGYDRMTVEALATRAGVSKPTIYRRWPGGKKEIVARRDPHQARGRRRAARHRQPARRPARRCSARWSSASTRTRTSPAG